MTSDSRVVRMKAAANHLGVGVKTLGKWVDNGQLPVITGPQRHSPWRFDTRDLESFLPKERNIAGLR